MAMGSRMMGSMSWFSTAKVKVGAFSNLRSSSTISTGPRLPRFISIPRLQNPNLLRLTTTTNSKHSLLRRCSPNPNDSDQKSADELECDGVTIGTKELFVFLLKYVGIPLVVMTLIDPVLTYARTRWEGQYKFLVCYSILMLCRVFFWPDIPLPLKIWFDPYLRLYHYVYVRLFPLQCSPEEMRQISLQYIPELTESFNEYGEFTPISDFGAIFFFLLVIWRYSFWNNAAVICFFIWVNFDLIDC